MEERGNSIFGVVMVVDQDVGSNWYSGCTVLNPNQVSRRGDSEGVEWNLHYKLEAPTRLPNER